MQRDVYFGNTSGSRNEKIEPPPLLAQINIKSLLPKLCMKSHDDQHDGMIKKSPIYTPSPALAHSALSE